MILSIRKAFAITLSRQLLQAAAFSTQSLDWTKRVSSNTFHSPLTYPSFQDIGHSYIRFSSRDTKLFSTLDDKIDSEANEWYEASLDEDDDEDTQDEEDEEDEDDPVRELFETLDSSLTKATNALTRKRDALQKELDKAKSLEDTMARANLLISNLYQLPSGTKSAIVQDWENDGVEIEITLSDEYNSAQEEADALFAAARKMKRGSNVVNDLIAETDDALEILTDMRLDLDYAGEQEELDQGRLVLISDKLKRTSKQTGFVMELNDNSNQQQKKKKYSRQSTRREPTFRKFLSPGGCIVLVGRNRKDNEAICFQVSRPTDVWMHSRGCPGAHVLLQIRRGSPRPTEECYQFAANLAAFYSDARTERKAPVTTASPKHIQKPRGAPLGAVKLREELNTLTGYPADVDDELKIARERSGVIWDESGSRSKGGKAKNRKKTMANAKQQVAKKRAEKREKKKRRQNASEESSEFW